MSDPDPAAAAPGDPRGDAGSRLVSSLARILADGSGPGPLRVLSLGPEASPLAAALRALGHQVTEPQPQEAEETLAGIAKSGPGTLDVVLALGFVERLRWDRWALQQMHQALRVGGTLLLAVPDLYSLRSLANPRYVAAKLAKILPRAGLGGGRPGPAREAVRSYSARRLRTTLGRLGYEPVRWSGLVIRPSRGLAGGGAWPPSHHLVLARKRPATAADPAAAVASFEAENRAFLSLCERWRREHALPDDAPRRLEPARFAGSRVLVLAPHPDDEIIGCGGTLLGLVRAGARVTVLQATDGSASAALEEAPPTIQRTVRLEEARAVAEAAGFEPSILWNEDNRAFRARDELVARLRGTLQELAPALVFTPFVADIHPDHRTLNRVLARALEGHPRERGTSIVGYEVWSLAPANLWCDVSERMPDVERLLLLYQTAMKVDDFIHMCSTRNRFHSLTLGGSPGYAEAFFASEVPRFCELVERLPEDAPGHAQENADV